MEPEFPVEALRKHHKVGKLPGGKLPNPLVDILDSAQIEPPSSLSIFSLIESR